MTEDEKLEIDASSRPKDDACPDKAAALKLIQDTFGTDYKPTPDECRVISALVERQRKRGPSPNYELEMVDGHAKLNTTHEDESFGALLVMEKFGTADPSFYDGLIGQLLNATKISGEVSERHFNFLVSIVKSIEPENEVEALLATQIAAVHSATMVMARRFQNVDTIQQQDSAERALNKLARTFTAQMETLKKYRSGGKQSINVHHHHTDARTQVAAEQAVVNVSAQGGGEEKKDQQPHERGSIEHRPAEAFDDGALMRGENKEWDAVPAPSAEG